MKKFIFLIVLSSALHGFAQDSTIENFEKSYSYEAEKKYDEAIKVLENPYDENSYPVNLRLGWLYYLKGEYFKSEGYYKKAISIEPSSIEARFGLAYPISALSHWDELMELYQEILTIDPNNTYTHYQLAYMYFLRSEYDLAEEHLLAVLRLYPFDFDSNSLLGKVYIKKGKIAEAKKHLIRALLGL